MTNVWFTSDTHFFHENIIRFSGRPFDNVESMNEQLVENWNKVVKANDTVYHLGDVALSVPGQREFTLLVHSLAGRKRLFLGNHDHIEQHAYRAFERIELWSGGKFKQHGFVCSHIPLRQDQMRDGEFNVHGHIHHRLIDDPHYINVCVEHTEYRPVHLDEILQRIKDTR